MNLKNISIKDLPCSKVIVYKDRAEVQREIKTNLIRGETQIVINSLSSCMDYESVRVEVSYGNGILIDVVTHDRIVVDDKKKDDKISSNKDEGIFSATTSEVGQSEVGNQKDENVIKKDDTNKEEKKKDDTNKEEQKKMTKIRIMLKKIKNHRRQISLILNLIYLQISGNAR